MRAAQVLRLDGPDGVEVADVAEPAETPGECLVAVHAVGVSFPDLLLSAGRYQLKPDPPFTIGVDFAGVVRTAPPGAGLAPGNRVAGWGRLGAAAELVSVRPEFLFPLPEDMAFEQGACLPMNYLTAHFTLRTRAYLKSGETVLVHGAAGGVGTAIVQVAKAYGARVVGVASTEEKGAVATRAGADVVVPARGFLEAARTATEGRGVDVVVDVVGGTGHVTDSLRALATGGRLMVVGFAGGEIPTVKLNRLLLGNTDVRGVSWGPYTRLHPGFTERQWDELVPLMRSGAIAPIVGRTYPLEDARQALLDMAGRRVLGKGVLIVR
jgi:NADPH2:quinone reductase